MENHSTSTFDVAVIGEINADLIIQGNVVPAFGQVEKMVESADLVMGSSAVIFACGCARLGLRTTFIGKVGDDLFGRFMLESMRERGVDTSHVVIDSQLGTGLSIILVQEDDRAILTYPGCIPALSYKDIPQDLFSTCRHVHLSSFFLLDELRKDIPKLFQVARQSGSSVSLDTNYDPAEKWGGGIRDTLKYVDVFLPNETEAKKISRKDDLEEALSTLSETVEIMAIKLGEKGAMAKQKELKRIYQKTANVDVIDTVGAGDSFDAGFVFGFLNGWKLEKSLQFAVACGSLSTMKPGGTEGQATVDAANEFIMNNLV